MTYPSRNSRISAGLGSSSSLTSSASASSSSMISLQRSMHSSQMYTPGPAMSFLTCFWDFPQKLHFTRSPPSPNFATSVPLVPFPLVAILPSERRIQPYRLRRSRLTLRRADCFDAHRITGRDYLVDQSVAHALLGRHDEVPVRVLGYLFHALTSVCSQHAIQQVAHAEDLLGLQLDVAGLALDPTKGLVQQDAGVGQ